MRPLVLSAGALLFGLCSERSSCSGVYGYASARIVGGSNVDVLPGEEYKYSFFAQWSGGCGASLIWEDILLTAAVSGRIDNAPQNLFETHWYILRSIALQCDQQ